MEIKSKESGHRLDQYLFQFLKEKISSRSLLSKYIKKGIITVNGKKVKPSYSVKIGDLITLPDEFPVEENILKPIDMELEIVYEDEDILIINKKPGQIVHPGVKHKNDTIVNALIKRYGDSLPVISGRERPGIIHRLDKDTSGLLIIALTERAYYKLIEMQKKKEIEKYYWGVVYGNVKTENGRIEIPIGRSFKDRKLFAPNGINAKDAITEFKVIQRKCDYSLLEFKLITGRTHQIRVHMKAIGYPIVGDIQYTKRGREIVVCGKKYVLNCHILMAKRLIFNHPISNEKMEIEIPFNLKPFGDMFKIGEK